MIASTLMRHSRLLVFLVALALRLGWVLTLDDHLTWVDEREFATIAQHLADGHGYVSSSYRANPVVPFYLSLVFRVFGTHFMAARIGQSIVGALACVLLLRIASLLINPITGLFSGLLLACYPPHIYVAGVFYVDCWLTFFFALAVYLATRTAVSNGDLRFAWLCGLCLGLATLTRAIFIICIPCVWLAWLLAQHWGWRKQLSAAGVLLFGCGLAVLPWTIRNYAAYGRFVAVSSGFYTKLWQGNNVLANGGPNDRDFLWDTADWRRRLTTLPELERLALQAKFEQIEKLVERRQAELGDVYLAMEEAIRPVAIESLLNDPWRVTKLMLTKIGTLYSAFSETESENAHTTRRNKVVAAISFYPILLLAFVGAAIGFPRRRELALIYLVIGAVTFAYAALTVCTRFRLPLDPFLIVFAALALSEAWAAVTRSWRIPSRVDAPAREIAVRRRTPLLPALPVVVRMTVLLVVFLSAGLLGYRAYLAAPATTSIAPQPSNHPALATRATVFVIDAFAPSRVFDAAVMPAFNRLVERGASGIAHTGQVTMTAPGVFSLTTGRPGTLAQALFDFRSPETRVDSLLSLMVATGRKVALSGDPSWHFQFGWLVAPEDRHEEPEPGITTSHEVDDADTRAVDFLLNGLNNPEYGISVVHIGSIDAVGHAVTPHVDRYYEQLRFVDTQIARVAAAMDFDHTVLLITGDHGMASRGTHGGEEEARLTPYVLVGAGIKPGVVKDIPHTALPATLSAVLGLPFLPVSEHPPATDLLDVSSEAARALDAEYFQGKVRAARAAGMVASPAASFDDQANAGLNDVLFGAEDSRGLTRMLTAMLVALGVLAASILAWQSVPAQFDRPTLSGHLIATTAVPVTIVVIATVFMALREHVELQSVTIATWIMVGLLALAMLTGLALKRSPRILRVLGRWRLSLFLPVLMILCAPLVNSHWLDARPYFEVLLLGLAGALMVASRPGSRTWSPAIAVACLYVPRLPVGLWQDGFFLPLLSGVVLVLAAWNSGATASRTAKVGQALLAAIFVAAWRWRLAASTDVASVVLALFVMLVVCAWLLRAHASSAAAVLIGASAALFLLMAADGHEASVFLIAAIVALVLSTRRIDLGQPSRLYVAAAIAILVRICLYYELGDQYNLSSIRTAPGFLLADYGLSLGTVTLLLLLKYSLPWVLIFAMGLLSILAADRTVRLHLIDLLILGYVARFAVVGSVVDPLRVLPNAMNGIVGTFCITWAEFLTFAIATVIAGLLTTHQAQLAPANPILIPEGAGKRRALRV